MNDSQALKETIAKIERNYKRGLITYDEAVNSVRTTFADSPIFCGPMRKASAMEAFPVCDSVNVKFYDAHHNKFYSELYPAAFFAEEMADYINDTFGGTVKSIVHDHVRRTSATLKASADRLSEHLIMKDGLREKISRALSCAVFADSNFVVVCYSYPLHSVTEQTDCGTVRLAQEVAKQLRAKLNIKD